MGIKKLIQNKAATTELLLKDNEGIIVFEIKNEKTLLYLQAPSLQDLEKLNTFENVNSYKYVGDEGLLKLILGQNLSWGKPAKEVFTHKSQKVIFYADTGKVRVEKQVKAQQQNNLTAQKSKNVLIIDDSKTIQKLLSKIINKSDVLNLIGVAGCPSEAREIIDSQRESIDLITLDIHMPEMNGVEFLKTYLAVKNIPTIMISSVSINEGPLVMEALSSGATTYIQKPSLEKLADVSADIVECLETVAKKGPRKIITKPSKAKLEFNNLDGLIAIGSSTGGTQALQEILTSLPDNIPPIVIVQHIPAVFSKALADRLNTLCKFSIKEAEDGDILESNSVYIAPGGFQMKLVARGKEKKISITNDPPINRFKPSVDYLFDSIAPVGESQLIGVVLTGMGDDGARGLLNIKNSTGYTISQDEESSVVFGMPKAAIEIGAVDNIVSLSNMASEIVLSYNNINKKKVA